MRRTAHPFRYAQVSTPLGRLFIAYRGKVVCCVALGSDERRFKRMCASAFDVPPIRDPHLPADMVKHVTDHLTGRRRFSGRIDLSHLTPFQRKVLQQVRTIPAGAVRSYRWVAHAIGSGRAVRAVGTALAKNPVPLLIPCHRVIRSDGCLGEYTGGGPSMKAKLLAFEGVDPENLTRLRSRPSAVSGHRLRLAANPLD